MTVTASPATGARDRTRPTARLVHHKTVKCRLTLTRSTHVAAGLPGDGAPTAGGGGTVSPGSPPQPQDVGRSGPKTIRMVVDVVAPSEPMTPGHGAELTRLEHDRDLCVGEGRTARGAPSCLLWGAERLAVAAGCRCRRRGGAARPGPGGAQCRRHRERRRYVSSELAGDVFDVAGPRRPRRSGRAEQPVRRGADAPARRTICRPLHAAVEAA